MDRGTVFSDSESQNPTKIIIDVDDKGQIFALNLDGDNDPADSSTPYMDRGEFLRRTRTVPKPQIKVHGFDVQLAQELIESC